MTINSSKLNDTVMVYVSAFDSAVTVCDVESAIRNDMIQRCTHLQAKQQRYCVWQLLDYALRECYGKGVKDFNFSVNGNGKWTCHNGVEFSLAHCGNVVAVAVCNYAVGVDVESISSFERHVDDTDFIERILTDSEQQVLRDTPVQRRAEILARFWTKKESLFKLQGGKTFVPRCVDTTENPAHSQLLTVNGEQYVLSVATDVPGKIEVAQVARIF